MLRQCILKCSFILFIFWSTNVCAAMHDLKITTNFGASGFNAAPTASLVGLGLGYNPFNHWLSFGGAFEYSQSIKDIQNNETYFQTSNLRLLPEAVFHIGYPFILSTGLGFGLQYTHQYNSSGKSQTVILNNQHLWSTVLRPKITIEYMTNAWFSFGLSVSSAIPLRSELLPEYSASAMFCFYQLMK